MYSDCELVSFDGGVRAQVRVHRPSAYRNIEQAATDGPLITRGGGYAYAAASFGEGSLTLDMSQFDRILSFDPESGTIEVEAGMTLGSLLAFVVSKSFWLNQIPGYPGITVGGAIAANVHGKNPARDGTFRESVLSLTLFHAAHGWITASKDANADLFDLTLGGYGLTGTIVKATLRLERLDGGEVMTEFRPLESMSSGLIQLKEAVTDGCDFAYTWHDGSSRRGGFGKGLLVRGSIEPGTSISLPFSRAFRKLHPMPTRGRLPVTIWGGWRTAAINATYMAAARVLPSKRRVSLFDSTFPFASRSMYFRLYGSRGLLESQLVIPADKILAFVAALEQAVVEHSAPLVMLSLKAMGGRQTLLRLEGNGFLLALNMPRGPQALAFMPVMDDLATRFDAFPSLIKDSRLPRPVVERCYPGLEEFGRRLRKFDPGGSYASELSRRLLF